MITDYPGSIKTHRRLARVSRLKGESSPAREIYLVFAPLAMLLDQFRGYFAKTSQSLDRSSDADHDAWLYKSSSSEVTQLIVIKSL